ncbi:small ribosomal subunit protein bS1m [Onthophagus taurus]|uniref:small ribosomal subunit protein bS1m n=1 Tax=Onthophagus taurus TaxID=166361 RepID=UPI000C20BCA9|nr:28S ribosomal protein S28, mitochondrial [Onthophagus taurus]
MSLTRNIVINILKNTKKSSWRHPIRFLSTESGEIKENKPQLGGYAKAYEKFENLTQEPKEPPKSFATLLRNSKFIDLGDPEGKLVVGRIVHIIDDDLYIDFGWKFNCVCSRPKKNATSYVRGAKVRLMIKDLELSTRFLGNEKDLTLLEADCVLLGLIQDRNKSVM